MVQNTAASPEHPGTLAQSAFQVMGSEAHLIMWGDIVWGDAVTDRGSPEATLTVESGTTGSGTSPGLLAARRRIEDLESKWSRFRSDSEISVLNSRDGLATAVSQDTSLLIQRSVQAWRCTGGLFDPTVLRSIIAAGYDRDFPLIGRFTDSLDTDAPPGCSEVDVDPLTGLVFLPRDVGLDPGGIGKGLAADLAAAEAVTGGSKGMLVSIGGDLRVAGTPPSQGWEIEVDHHVAPPARINLRAGAIATSSVLRRCWDTPGGPAHHVIDPRTGAPSDGAAVAVSVVAGEAWWAEALATAILVGYHGEGTAEELDGMLGSAGALVTLGTGTRVTLGGAGDAFSFEPQPSAESHRPCEPRRCVAARPKADVA